jgi:putative membrane protein
VQLKSGDSFAIPESGWKICRLQSTTTQSFLKIYTIKEKLMWGSAITAYLHYLSFMLAFGALATESLMLKRDLRLEEAWRVVIADTIYGLSATGILITGILKVIYFGKGTDYYLSSPAFYTKVGIFVLISLLSIYPTFSFVSWVKGLRDGKTPSLELPKVQRLSWMIKGELLGFVLIPLFAAVLARGIVL